MQKIWHFFKGLVAVAVLFFIGCVGVMAILCTHWLQAFARFEHPRSLDDQLADIWIILGLPALIAGIAWICMQFPFFIIVPLLIPLSFMWLCYRGPLFNSESFDF